MFRNKRCNKTLSRQEAIKAVGNWVLYHLATIAFLTVCFGKNAEASFILSIAQSGGSVIGVGSGTINTDGLIDMGQTGGGGFIWGSYPVSGSAIGLGNPSVSVEGFTGLIVGPNAFGSGPLFQASSGEGDPVDIAPVVNTVPLFGAVFVPVDYVSGSSLSDTSTWDNTTIAALGLIPGIYTYTWDSGATADSFTINVISTPEPGTNWLVGVGTLGLMCLFVSIYEKPSTKLVLFGAYCIFTPSTFG